MLLLKLFLAIHHWGICIQQSPDCLWIYHKKAISLMPSIVHTTECCIFHINTYLQSKLHSQLVMLFYISGACTVMGCRGSNSHPVVSHESRNWDQLGFICNSECICKTLNRNENSHRAGFSTWECSLTYVIIRYLFSVAFLRIFDRIKSPLSGQN